MQSNCTFSDFGTIHVSAMLPFMLEERKWQAAFQSVYFLSALATYNKGRCDINLPERLDWVKFVGSSRPIPAGLVVS